MCACVILAAGCVETDTPEDQDTGFVPFEPDQSMPDASADMMAPDVAGDLGGADASPDIDQGLDMRPDMNDPRVCLPNNDGVITRAEVPLAAGLSATYSVASGVMFDTAGLDAGDGTLIWDVSGDFPGDSRVIVEAGAPTGRWFSPDFPQATYVTPLSTSSDLFGIFAINPESLGLLGVASPAEGFTATKLTYAPSVKVLDFPVEMGKSWSDDAEVTGTVNGVLSVYNESYTSQVDARGTLKTSYGDFDVLRIRVELERTVGFLPPTTVRTYLFVSECFGTVGTVVSQDNEAAVEFTQAAELRRLSR